MGFLLAKSRSEPPRSNQRQFSVQPRHHPFGFQASSNWSFCLRGKEEGQGRSLEINVNFQSSLVVIIFLDFRPGPKWGFCSRNSCRERKRGAQADKPRPRENNSNVAASHPMSPRTIDGSRLADLCLSVDARVRRNSP
jgi:hypothetical protein